MDVQSRTRCEDGLGKHIKTSQYISGDAGEREGGCGVCHFTRLWAPSVFANLQNEMLALVLDLQIWESRNPSACLPC